MEYYASLPGTVYTKLDFLLWIYDFSDDIFAFALAIMACEAKPFPLLNSPGEFIKALPFEGIFYELLVLVRKLEVPAPMAD